MDKIKTVFLEPLGVDDMPEIVISALGDKIEPVFFPDRIEDPDVLAQRCGDAQIAVLSNIPFKRNVLEKCPALKMICVAFTGVDHVDMDYCREHGIFVCNCSGYSTASVSELVFGFAIGFMRNLCACDKATRELKTKNGLVGDELEGKTFGVIGTGAIGSRVAAVANAFGCRVLTYSRTKKDLPGTEFVTLDELLSQSDIVSVHVPQTAQTIGMIGERELGLMKPGAILINTARGPIVDEEALSEALKNGRLAGACVDVFSTEPPLKKDNPVLSAPNTFLAPHIGFATKRAFVKRLAIVCSNIEGWIDGKPVNAVK